MGDANGSDNTIAPQPGLEPDDALITPFAPAGPLPPVGKATVGQRLRAAREALGLSLPDIAQRTRITQRHVGALERGDYDSMPGRPYAIGFARTYARTVGLEETAIVAAVRAELAARSAPVDIRTMQQFEVGDPAKTPSRAVAWLAFLLVIAVVGAGMVYWRSYYQPSIDLPSLVQPDPPAPVPLAHAQPAPRPSPTALPNGPVVFTALEDNIWVKFYDGAGKQLLQKQMAKGETYTVPADASEPMVWTGRPDALAISIGGQDVPKLADAQHIVRNVPVSAEALRARGQPVPAASTGAPDSQTLAAAATPANPVVPHHRRRAAAPAADSAGDATGDPTATGEPVLPST